MQKVGVSPLRQKQEQISGLGHHATSNEKVIEELVMSLQNTTKKGSNSPLHQSGIQPIQEERQPDVVDSIQQLLMSKHSNTVSPAKPQLQEKPRQRESVKNDLPDSENDEEEGEAGSASKTAHFPQTPAPELQNYDGLQQMDPIDMITNLLNQNKTAGREEIEQLLQQHQRHSNLSNKNRDSQLSQSKPVRQNIVFGRKRSPMNGD